MHFTNSWVVSGRLQLWDWLFLSLQKACNCAKCNCLLTCLTAYLSLLGTERPENCQIMAEPGHLYQPWENTCQLLCTAQSSVSKTTQTQENQGKKTSDCQKAGWAEIVASCAHQCLKWQLFSVWTVQKHLAGRLGYVLWVEWLQSRFCCCTVICRNTVSKNGWVRNDKTLLGSL